MTGHAPFLNDIKVKKKIRHAKETRPARASATRISKSHPGGGARASFYLGATHLPAYGGSYLFLFRYQDTQLHLQAASGTQP